MAIIVSEKYKGQTSDATSAEVLYIVQGTGVDAGNVQDGDAFDAVVNSAPATHRGLPLTNVQVREELVQGTFWVVSASYGADTTDSVLYSQSSVDYEFSYQAPSEKIYQSLQTISATGPSGAEDPNHFRGAINVVNDNGELKVEGLDAPPGSPTSSWIYKPLYASITNAYQSGVEAIMGDVNSFAFKGRPAGTMRFVSCDGGAQFTSGTNPKWQIKFGFQFSRNRSNIDIGGVITVPFKAGHHLLWGYYDDANAAAPMHAQNQMIIKTPKLMFVEKVFEESNFNVLGLGS